MRSYCCLLLLLWSIASPILLFSQTTKTTLGGHVSAQFQKELTGVSISLIHLPTGTIYGCSTNSSGFYFLPDLQPGGPYRLEANFNNFEKYQETGIFFKLGQPANLNIVMQTRPINCLK
jgi:hypothetical protein